MILAPAALILRQPDLGTALLLVLGGGIMLFLAGIKAWKIGVGVVLALGSGPIAWQFLHDYQKARILTFFDPEADPLGAGYHILQVEDRARLRRPLRQGVSAGHPEPTSISCRRSRPISSSR